LPKTFLEQKTNTLSSLIKMGSVK